MQTQRWEYAYILQYRSNVEAHNWLNLVYLHPEGHKYEVVDKKGLTSKTPDWSEHFRAWVTKLGEEGYEMIGFMQTGFPDDPMFHYWFKRPLTP